MSNRRFVSGRGALFRAALDSVHLRRPPTAAMAEAAIIGSAATRDLNALLIRHKSGWDDVAMLSNRRAKLCGALRFAFEAKWKAARAQMVRLIIRYASTWSLLIYLPFARRDTALRSDPPCHRTMGWVRLPACAPLPVCLLGCPT